jgi:putative addiction module component (TIGR02574 family)
MSSTSDRLVSEIRALPDADKLRVIEAILTDLEKPDPEIDGIWAEEARKRWTAYKAGRIPTVSYEDVMDKHRPR